MKFPVQEITKLSVDTKNILNGLLEVSDLVNSGDLMDEDFDDLPSMIDRLIVLADCAYERSTTIGVSCI